MKQQELSTATDRSLRRAISNDYLAEETGHVRRLARQAKLLPSQRRQVDAMARAMIESLRKQKLKRGSLEAFMNEYDLSTEEGSVMMCMAEALLRIPDTATRDALIHDSLVRGNWQSHLGHSDSRLVDAATWALMLSGRVVQAAEGLNPLDSTLKRLLAKRGEPVIRESIMQAMHVVGNHFVCGESIQQALDAVQSSQNHGYRYSFDMLGEAALTAEDAQHYAAAYEGAIRALARRGSYTSAQNAPGISVKLSALHPRFHPLQAERVKRELPDVLLQLAQLAKNANIGLTVDAEEADRLDLTLDVFASVYKDPSLAGWDGLGLAVQAYQKRAPAVIEWLDALAHDRGRRIPTRLVKGAYWDTEIKQAQRLGLADYPVFTRKTHTDVSYMACVRQLFRAPGLLPQFATHNAHSIAAVRCLAPADAAYEFQRLHGMAETLYDPLVAEGLACRVYAPVGSHKHLLAYLVRRLLENGANNSFVNRLHKSRVPVSQLSRDPVEAAREHKCLPHPRIPLPEHIYGPERAN
ncbi:MAG: proline dehydrogenase family protein, partial [Nevskiales bacterium]